MSALVVGVGNADCGDDGAGPAVARLVRDLGLPDVRVLPQLEPMDLLLEDVAEDVVVVVDAARSGAPPGTVLVVDARADPLPAPSGAGSTHALGLDTVVELLGTLDRLPHRLLLVAVEGAGFEPGAALSTEVLAALPHAVERVLAELVAPSEAPGGGP
jgi:hydrogenase maturation protease